MKRMHYGRVRGRPGLEYDSPERVRADIRAVLDDVAFWLTPAYDVAIHAERLLARVEALESRGPFPRAEAA